MRFDILTLFPELISGYFEDSIIKKAREKNLISIHMHQLRDYALDKHKQVDDSPYGGGVGMVMKVDVLGRAVEEIKTKIDKEPYVIYLSPQGEKLTNSSAREFAKMENILLVCGRYEGVDQRFIDIYVDKEISIGDYVLSGGELPAAVVVDAVCRFIPGVVGKDESVMSDSLENSMLKYPQYTRPQNFNGNEVPDVLMSGNHAEIEKWRASASIQATKRKRRDLL